MSENPYEPPRGMENQRPPTRSNAPWICLGGLVTAAVSFAIVYAIGSARPLEPLGGIPPLVWSHVLGAISFATMWGVCAGLIAALVGAVRWIAESRLRRSAP